MIDRYSRKEVKEIWEDKNRYKIWLEIEIAAAQAMEKLKIIPKGVSSKTRRRGKINVSRIQKIESKGKKISENIEKKTDKKKPLTTKKK